MPGRPTKFEALAAEAAQRIDRDRHMAEQLTMLPDVEDDQEDGSSSKGTRGKGKATSQLRQWLAQRGYELPEEQLARMAGLADGHDPITGAMADAERVLAWAAEGASQEADGIALARKVAGQINRRLEAFKLCYAARQKAAEALLPYGLTKATPDPEDGVVIPAVLVPQAPSSAPLMRDVTPDPARRMAPAQVRHQIEQKQGVSSADPDGSDKGSRTE